MKIMCFTVLPLLFALCLSSCESSELVENFSENPSLETSEQKEIKEVALSFHQWYLTALQDDNNSNWSPSIVKNDNGKCAFEFSDYFDALRNLGTISETFIQSEKERVSVCADFLETINYEDYISSDAYAFQDECPQFYHMYWIQSQEPFTGVELDTLMTQQDVRQVKLIFYTDFNGQKEYSRLKQPIVTLNKENSTWKIVQIDWAD